jgi:uncharacterized BrkB/YihY/UPF0761 family membrane protein
MPSLPQPLGKFFDDRGPHLAAMIAYFALLSFVPLLFLTISLLSLAGRPDESSYLVTELKRAFPGSSISSIVHTVRAIQNHATALGILGAGRAALDVAVALQRARVRVQHRLRAAEPLVPARQATRGRPDADLARDALLRAARRLVRVRPAQALCGRGASNSYVAYGLSVAVSTIAVFVFLLAVYYLLTNVEHTFKDVLPGAVVAASALEASFQVLPPLRALLEQRRRAEGLRRPGPAARLGCT